MTTILWPDSGERIKQRAPTGVGNELLHIYIKKSYLTDIETKKPPLTYLRPDEQPHFLFNNVNKGLRIEHPDWDDKKTPHNVSLAHSGDRYLFVTDQRLLLIAGDTETGDTIDAFPYTDLVSVEAHMGFLKNPLKVEHRDGRLITFFEEGSFNQHIEDAGEYIDDRISASPDELASSTGPTETQADAGTPDIAGGPRETTETSVFTEAVDEEADDSANDGTHSESDTEIFTPESEPSTSSAGVDIVQYCPSCGQDLRSLEERRFCPACGHKIQ